MTSEQVLARYGLLKQEVRLYEYKRKFDTQTLFSNSEKGIMIPFGIFDDSWGGVGSNFNAPNDIYQKVGLNTDELKHGVGVKLTVFNDSEQDYLTLRTALFKSTEDDADHIPTLDPTSMFDTNETLGDDQVRLMHVNRHKDTAPIYQNPRTYAIPPKQLVVLDKDFLAPEFMHSASDKNKYWAYGARLDFDTKITMKLEVWSKIENLNPSS